VNQPLKQFEKDYVRPAPGRTLIVGSKVYPGRGDRRRVYSDVVGVDMLPGDGVDLVHNLEHPPQKSLGQFAHIECWSVLEHSRRPWKLASNLQRLMSPGGTIFLTVPFIWRIHGYPNDYFRFTPEGVRSLFPAVLWAKICLAHEDLKSNDLTPSLTSEDGHPYLARTEVLAFGSKP
jgi:hypothetical protein